VLPFCNRSAQTPRGDRNSLASECEFDMLASFYSSSGMTNDELQVPIMGCGRDFFFLVGAL
jgi:hypothetical protein